MYLRSNELLDKIERKRYEMVTLGLTSSFADERVIQLSTKLDKLLNTYHTLAAKKQ